MRVELGNILYDSRILQWPAKRNSTVEKNTTWMKQVRRALPVLLAMVFHRSVKRLSSDAYALKCDRISLDCDICITLPSVAYRLKKKASWSSLLSNRNPSQILTRSVAAYSPYCREDWWICYRERKNRFVSSSWIIYSIHIDSSSSHLLLIHARFVLVPATSYLEASGISVLLALIIKVGNWIKQFHCRECTCSFSSAFSLSFCSFSAVDAAVDIDRIEGRMEVTTMETFPSSLLNISAD